MHRVLNTGPLHCAVTLDSLDTTPRMGFIGEDVIGLAWGGAHISFAGEGIGVQVSAPGAALPIQLRLGSLCEPGVLCNVHEVDLHPRS